MCHPIYDDGVMLDLIKHALHSSLAAQTTTATFVFLPYWKGMSTNAYMKVVNNHPESCNILGHIPQTLLTYGKSQGWVGAPNVLPPPRWDMNIIVLWNGEARKQLSETNLDWYTGLRQSIPEAKWNLNPCPPTSTSATIPTWTRAFKSKRDDNTPTRMAYSSQLAHTSLSPLADHHLQLKVPDWRKWAHTDGSCLTSFSPQRIGAGVYIPSSNTSIYVNSG